MKNLILIPAIALLLIATPALAKEHNQGNSNNNAHRFAVSADTGGDEDDPLPSTSPNPSGTPNPTCNPNDDYENHGAYVSCVARLKLGGGEVSEAAQSNIGRREEEEEQENASPVASPSSTPTPTPSPTVSPSESPSPTASGSASPSPSASGSASLSAGTQLEVTNIIGILQGIIKSLQNLL